MKKSGPKSLFFIFPKVRRECSSPIQRSESVNRMNSVYTERGSYGKLLLLQKLSLTGGAKIIE